MSKEQLAQFRALQYALPHPAQLHSSSQQPLCTTGAAEAPDEGRVILHFDIDAFYAQVEKNRNPGLRNRPLGVTQKYLIVTSNYHARARGVTKLQNIYDAKVKCPELVLVSGEDLSPYRQASRAVLSVLARFGVVEKGGMDEAFVDVTKEAKQRVAHGACPASWHGHLHLGDTELVADNPHRPMDLRVLVQQSPSAAAATMAEFAQGTASWQALLRAGSAIAAEARAALKAEAGYRTSTGIACNKLLAKLASGLHKPDDQTILPPPVAASFIAPLPVRVIQGVGYKMDADLRQLGIETANDLRQQPQAKLIRHFGERIGMFLHLAARGKDSSPVVPVGPPKTVTVEDSFKGCPSIEAARRVVKVLAPDLLARLQEEHEEFGRRPQKLLLKWRLQGQGYHNHNSRASASCNMPPVVQAPYQGAVQAEAIEKAAVTLLSRSVSSPFNLTLLNLGATNFSRPAAHNSIFNRVRAQPAALEASEGPPDGPELSKRAADAATAARRDYSAAPEGAALSKRAERAMREGAGGAGCCADLLPSTGSSSQCVPRSATQQPPQQQQRAPLPHNGINQHATWIEAPSEPHGYDSGSEDGDGGITDEWRDILQSQHQPDEGHRLSAIGTAAPAGGLHQDSPAMQHRRQPVPGAAHQSSAAATAAASLAHDTATAPMAAAGADASSPPPPPSPRAARAQQPAEAGRPLSDQEVADRRLAEKLQREEEAAEAHRRRRSREVFLAGTAASSSAGQRAMQPVAKRLKAGPLDMFVKKRT